jgi:hypothetical protein
MINFFKIYLLLSNASQRKAFLKKEALPRLPSPDFNQFPFYELKDRGETFCFIQGKIRKNLFG